jgi:hypothetical protein
MHDRQALAAHLRESAGSFGRSITGIPSAQFHFKPGPDRWSIAETAEHVIVSETGSTRLIKGKLLREPASPETLAATADGWDRIDLRLAPAAGPRPAPEFVLPTGRWGGADEMLAIFTESRNGLVEFLETTAHDLTRHAALHPALGMLDGLQWIYFIHRHCLRHLAQIEAIRQDPGFPPG